MTKEQLIVLLDTILGEQAKKHGAFMSDTEDNINEGDVATYDGRVSLEEVAEKLLQALAVAA